MSRAGGTTTREKQKPIVSCLQTVKPSELVGHIGDACVIEVDLERKGQNYVTNEGKMSAPKRVTNGV